MLSHPIQPIKGFSDLYLLLLWFISYSVFQNGYASLEPLQPVCACVCVLQPSMVTPNRVTVPLQLP